MHAPAATAPIPPAELTFRVSGGTEASDFLALGKDNVGDYESAIGTIGKHFSNYEQILDFGCGCGRLLRWLRDRLPPQRLHGSDIDAPAVEWVMENLGIDARTNSGLPPLDFPDASFDLIIGHSVFTHRDETYQDAWLAELHRVAKPGCDLLLTFHGLFNWEHAKTHLPAVASLDREFSARGFVYWSHDGWEKHFPDFLSHDLASPDICQTALGPLVRGDRHPRTRREANPGHGDIAQAPLRR
jgi:SAM-dependent methyltransferase